MSAQSVVIGCTAAEGKPTPLELVSFAIREVSRQSLSPQQDLEHCSRKTDILLLRKGEGKNPALHYPISQLPAHEGPTSLLCWAFHEAWAAQTQERVWPVSTSKASETFAQLYRSSPVGRQRDSQQTP